VGGESPGMVTGDRRLHVVADVEVTKRSLQRGASLPARVALHCGLSEYEGGRC
jgi:hypothetical protein